jgi:hypothetical protein
MFAQNRARPIPFERFLFAIFGGTRQLEPPSDRIGTRRQFFDLFRNGGDFARRPVHESPQLKLDVAIWYHNR